MNEALIKAQLESLKSHTGEAASRKKAQLDKELQAVRQLITKTKPPDEQLKVLQRLVANRKSKLVTLQRKHQEQEKQMEKLLED